MTVKVIELGLEQCRGQQWLLVYSLVDSTLVNFQMAGTQGHPGQPIASSQDGNRSP